MKGVRGGRGKRAVRQRPEGSPAAGGNPQKPPHWSHLLPFGIIRRENDLARAWCAGDQGTPGSRRWRRMPHGAGGTPWFPREICAQGDARTRMVHDHASRRPRPLPLASLVCDAVRGVSTSAAPEWYPGGLRRECIARVRGFRRRLGRRQRAVRGRIARP